MIDNILNTAHIHLSTATFRVYVRDINKYKPLFDVQGEWVEVDILEVSHTWRAKMGFPDFVIDVSPKWDEGYLSVWVTDDYNIEVLNKWLKKFE